MAFDAFKPERANMKPLVFAAALVALLSPSVAQAPACDSGWLQFTSLCNYPGKISDVSGLGSNDEE